MNTGYLDLWADSIFVNGAGDIAWSDGISEESYVAIPNVPEPPTLFLLGTGLLLALAGTYKMGCTVS